MKKTLFSYPCTFVLSVMHPEQLPYSKRVEIAFWGRSNCGKSSLLNRLVQHNQIARTSRTPGRTQALNFFSVGEKLYLVDMQGYGYAKTNVKVSQQFNHLIADYLENRRPLNLLCLLLDARRGVMEQDRETLQFLAQAGIEVLPIITKQDQVPRHQHEKLIHDIQTQLNEFANIREEIFLTSALKNQGFDALRKRLSLLISQKRVNFGS